MEKANPATFSLKPEYTTPYAALIREDVVMGVSRYFIERWLPVLGSGPATVVNTLRQLDYRCHQDVIVISGEALAREASLSRRYLYTCLDMPWIKAFVRVESGQWTRNETGKLVQQENHYHIRMDDPLNPADADRLVEILSNLADTPLEAARRALELDARALWAASPTLSPERFTEPRPITARDALARAFPVWQPASEEQKQAFAQAAEALQRHVTLTREDGRVSKIIVPQYFRKFWWKRLGHDLAWAYLWLRGWVYDNAAEDIHRHTCWIPTLDVLLAATGRPREWWRRNVENAKASPDGWALKDFFQQINAEKGRDPAHPQWVARQFMVATEIPIAPEHRARYAELLATWQEKPTFLTPDEPLVLPAPAAGSATSVHTGPKKVCHIDAHRAEEGLPHPCTPENRGSATSVHTGEPGVCHIDAQGSATSAHRESESLNTASKEESQSINSTKQTAPVLPITTAGTLSVAAGAAMKLPLIDQIAEKLEKTPETPLYNCASVYAWMRDPWPDDPIRPYTPAWTLVVNGQVSPRDLVAAILAIWIEPSIKHPSRYLSWLLQRWSMADHKTEPFLHWERCRALAEMPIGKWFKEGYQEWLEIAPRNNRALPFGLDTLDGYDDEADAMLPESESEDEANLPPPPPPPENEANGLDEHPGSSPFTIREIWFGAQGRLSAQFNGSTYDNWVAGSKLVSYTDGVITIRARHVMAHFWLSERLNPAIEEAVSAVARTPLKIRYVVDPPFSVSPLPG